MTHTSVSTQSNDIPRPKMVCFSSPQPFWAQILPFKALLLLSKERKEKDRSYEYFTKSPPSSISARKLRSSGENPLGSFQNTGSHGSISQPWRGDISTRPASSPGPSDCAQLSIPHHFQMPACSPVFLIRGLTIPTWAYLCFTKDQWLFLIPNCVMKTLNKFFIT